jgi:ABC-type polysaccharide/polyol phosphate transport system ATPase subunit
LRTSEKDGSRPVSIEASGLGKRFVLGEHRNLGLTVRRLLRKKDATSPERLEALSEVDFTVRRGEAVGIVGVNGSGKSTLLQILAGTTLPTSGAMRVHGRVIPLLAVGLNFHPELTGRENVTLFASSLGIPRRTIDARMDAVTEFAELERHMDTPVKRFSSGMTSRLSFSIGMQFPADIYVFDEVLAVVDGEFQARCLDEIKRLHAEGRTIIFVSHSLDQIASVCDSVMWLERGAVKRIGPTQQVLTAYQAALSDHSGVT